MRIPFGVKVLYWAPKKQRKPERSKFSGTGIEGIFLGYHIQPGFIFKLEYVEQLSEDLDEMFPELFGPDRDKDPPPKDAKEATRKGESKFVSCVSLLDDVPYSVKQKLKSSAAVAAQEPPYGYVWSGECLVKENNRNRPNAIDHTAWKSMSKRQRATAIAEHEKKLHEENEALYREAVKVDWWDGETYFDLAGREQSDFELAVVDNKVSVAAAPDAAKAVEDFAKQLFDSNDYSYKTFEVNTGEDDRTGVVKAMKTILQSAALNSDIISLGAETEYRMLESAYGCVSTQVAAGVSLTHADTSCSALRQLADLSDEGMAKLKPTARLSPKVKRALILVSDSSTALCKKNRRGVFVKADLGEEVGLTSMMLGWSECRYTMCWGKTLAWIVWQVEERIKDLRTNHPGLLIDVVCWWCGNEISGQWGCIPTRLGPGFGYRDPTVTTEAVAGKVRRAADVLAALTGEPDIGFVKVIGVEADLFQLHSAYNDFNAAMFEEFRSRNLQVQSASPLVERLEMYDSFHASEDLRNRELFVGFLHATLNVSKSEWIAQKLNPCVKALLVRFEHYDTGVNTSNPVLQDVFKQWQSEKQQLMNPKIAKPMPVTEEDKRWEAPDAADATDVTKNMSGPPMDKAIRKDVPAIGATTDVSKVAECINDIVTQDADGKVSYSVPGTVQLVDEGDKVDPIPSSMGRVMEPAVHTRTKKSDRDEDAMRRMMFIDESAPQGAATVPEKLPNEYFYNGAKHLMKPFNPEDIVGDKHVTFKHGDLKFLTKLLRGHAMEDFPALIFDRWHNQKLIGNNPDADFFLATRFYSGLSQTDSPAKLYHRTNERGMKGILRDGMIPGSARSDRSHNYLSPYRLDDTNYKSGMRSNQPIELAIDTQRAIAAGCVFFVTETDGVLTRDNVPPDCILSAVDTSKKNLPLYVAEHKEATREGEPEHVFRAKRDYEEAAASSSSAPPPKQAAIAPKAIASKKMRKVASKPTAVIEKDDAMDLDEATREGEPADADGFAPEPEAEAKEEEGDTTDLTSVQAVPGSGGEWHVVLSTLQSSTDGRLCEDHKTSLREFDLLASDHRGLGDGPKKRGQMSAEAGVIRDAKDRKQRASKLGFDSLSYRFEKDEQFSTRMMQEGRSIEDMQKFDHLANAVLPDPGRSEEQRYLRADSHYGGGSVPPAKLVYYAHCEVEPLRSLRFIDDTADVPIGLTYMGAFLPPRLFAEVAAVNEAAKRILTFDGEVVLSATTTDGITTEIGQILADSLRSARDQTYQTERLADCNRQTAAQNRPSQKGRGRGRVADPEPMYRGYTQAQWDEYYRQRRGGYTQAEWDAWNRTHGNAFFKAVTPTSQLEGPKDSEEPASMFRCSTPFVALAGEDDAIVAVKQQQAVPSQWEQWVGSVVGWFTNVLHVGGPKDEIVLSLEEFTQLRDHLLRMQGYIKEAEDRAEQAEALLELFRRHGSEARHVAEAVQLIQRIGEGLAWAYGQPHREIGEAFAQPFVDRRIRDRLRDLLFTQHPHLQAQVLQTIHILLAATPPSCIGDLAEGNEVVTASFDFRQNEDLLPLWITVVKDIATMMREVRTHVQATSLEIFSKLKHVLISGIIEDLKIADSWSNSLFELVVEDSKILFTHVCCLLRDFWRMADETIRSTIWRDMKNAFSLQNDILEYINDVFASAKDPSKSIPKLGRLSSQRLADPDPATKDVNQLSAILQVLQAWTSSFGAVHAVWSQALSQLERTPQDLGSLSARLSAPSEERLLRFAVLPVLLGSALQAQQQPLLTQEASWYLLGDLLATLRSHHVRTVLATTLLRPHVTEEILQLVVSPPPNTPAAYFHLQRSWGGTPQQSYFDTQESAADHQTLYEPVPIPVVAPGESSGKPLHRNSLLEALELRLRRLAFDPGRDGARGAAGSVLASSGCLAAFVGQAGLAFG
ncbi:NLRC3 [Symbiodinium sp. CCMP2592]|nr:NLRC3 [Symbiodinium sp. CCMP2592]